MNSEDGQVYSVCVMDVCVLLQFSCFTKYINKQHVNIADETLTDYSFRSVGINILNNLFKKTISNSSLNSHVYWDTLYNPSIQSLEFYSES